MEVKSAVVSEITFYFITFSTGRKHKVAVSRGPFWVSDSVEDMIVKAFEHTLKPNEKEREEFESFLTERRITQRGKLIWTSIEEYKKLIL